MTWTRRIFLRETIGGWLALLLAPSGYALIRRWLSHSTGSKIDAVGLGMVADFKSGSSRIVMLGDEKVIVGRLGNGTFHAVSGICTHFGCSIRFEQTGGNAEFACNCHDSRFDLDGINLSGPASVPLKRFEVEIQGKEWRLVRSSDANGS
jgi:Rieske Fe-S protein